MCPCYTYFVCYVVEVGERGLCEVVKFVFFVAAVALKTEGVVVVVFPP